MTSRSTPCSICSATTHSSRNCTELRDLLKDGFFAGGGAHRDHGDDEEDALCRPLIISVRQFPGVKIAATHKSKMCAGLMHP